MYMMFKIDQWLLKIGFLETLILGSKIVKFQIKINSLNYFWQK